MMIPTPSYRNPETQRYLETTEYLAQTKSPHVFENGKPIDANIVLAMMFKYSTQEVDIYDHILDGGIAGQDPIFFMSLEDFLESGRKLRILLRSDEVIDNHMTNRMARYQKLYKKNLEIRYAREDFSQKVMAVYDKDMNFAIGDKTSYRMEINSNAETGREAECSFNQPETAKVLSELFSSNFSFGREAVFTTVATAN